MQLLESEWFFGMVERHGRTPAERLVCIFTLAEQWLQAPGIRDQFTDAASPAPLHQLERFIARTALAAKVERPELLAQQLLILLKGALAEEQRNPASLALHNAAAAARAVVDQARRPARKSFLRTGTLMAGLFSAGLLTAGLWHMAYNHHPEGFPRNLALKHGTPEQALATGFNPSDMVAALALQEKFERGICPAPHMLTLPAGQMTAYMDAVNLRLPEDPGRERQQLRNFLDWYNRSQASACYYAPTNGHTMVNWR